MRFLATPQQQQAAGPGVRRAVSDLASPFGCCDFFSNCSDQIFALYYRGVLDLLDWMGFEVSDECYRVIDFISFIRPDEGGGSAGYLPDPCSTPNGVEFGACSLDVNDFGRYGRQGPTRDLFKPMKYCKTRPRRFLDGSPVTSEFDWDLMFAMDQMLNDIRKALITGNSSTPGQFDGLQRWVRNGYDCAMLDSYVVNWNGNPMSGGSGITINGNATPSGFDFVDFLLDLHRNIKKRISWSPMLKNQPRRTGDTILLLPDFLARCLLDFYTCWSVCPGAQYEEVVKNSKEMRDFRLELDGGFFGDGQISLDGDTIPLLRYDWELINGPTTGDIYYLTGSIGSQRLWEGEHLDANIVLSQLGDVEGNPGNFFSRDGGRVLGWVDVEGTCRTANLIMRPRLFNSAPWAQIRFQNVKCSTPTGPLSPDPSMTSFYPQSDQTSAICE